MYHVNDPFSINQIDHKDGAVLAALAIDPGSDIFKGHFPGHPVVPGACMLQIVKEVLENVVKHPLRLRKADQVKFMVMIDPTATQAVQLDIAYKTEDDIITLNAKL